MRKEIIVWIDHVLTPEERRNFSKNYPGKRLCFRLRYPYAPLIISCIALCESAASLIISVVKLLM